MATDNATKMATAAPMCMCSLLRIVYTSQGDHGSGRDFKVAHHPPLRWLDIPRVAAPTQIYSAAYSRWVAGPNLFTR